MIKVHAVSLNATDWEYLRGKPLYARIIGLLKPKKNILGSDIAGRVEAVGSKVKKVKPGDEVFGDVLYSLGGFAEYVCAPEKTLLLKPVALTFEEVSTLPQASVIALQGIRDKGELQQGQKVLINGAGGCVGVFAIQLAKSFGAEVTGVDSAEKLELMRSLGADHVIDYRKEDFTRTGQHYDFILDVVACRSVFDYKRALSPKGACYIVGGSIATMLQAVFLGPLIRMFGGKKIAVLGVMPDTEDLAYMADLFEAGKVVPVVDRKYPLDEVPDALRYFGEGHPKGKIIITVEEN